MVRILYAGYLALLLLMAGCSQDQPSHGASSSTPPRGKKTPVSLTLEPRISGNSLFIEGTTDLPDGTFISYEMKHENYDKVDTTLIETDRKRFIKEHDRTFRDGDAIVSGGKFSEPIDISDWRPGSVEVWAAFQTIIGTSKKQPDITIERVGKMGEYMEGPTVVRKSLGRGEALYVAELTRNVRIGRSQR